MKGVMLVMCLLLLFASCKKEYLCSCVYKTGMLSGYERQFTIKAYPKKADEVCKETCEKKSTGYPVWHTEIQ